MKKGLTAFLILITYNLTVAQTTAIPDANFEQALINLGLDTGIPDGTIPTSNIDTLTHLDVNNLSISDLTGIEDFTSLDWLYCFDNQLTSLNLTQNNLLEVLDCGNNQLLTLDITQNTSLTYLRCSSNQLTNIDVSQNPLILSMACNVNQIVTIDVTQLSVLELLSISNNPISTIDVTQNSNLILLDCSYNQFTSLNLSQNTSLTGLWCSNNAITSLDLTPVSSLVVLYCNNNQLTSLDLSQNINFTDLMCENNLLTCLNIKNGNNINHMFFNATNNLNLACIEVDDASYSNANWTNIDATSSFSSNCNNSCSTVSIDEYNASDFSIYPNPTSDQLTIESELDINEVSIVDLTGKTILTSSYEAHINVANLSAGVYFIKLINDNKTVTKKFIKQ